MSANDHATVVKYYCIAGTTQHTARKSYSVHLHILVKKKKLPNLTCPI